MVNNIRRVNVFFLLVLVSVNPAHAVNLSQHKLLLVNIEGSHATPTIELVEVTQKCLAQYDYVEKDRDPKILDECLRLLRHHMTSHGYLKARAEVSLTKAKDDPTISVVVEEGPRYRLGNVGVEGTTILTSEYVKNLLELRSGEILSGDAVSEWLYVKLKREYDKLGYIQFSPELVPEFRESPEKGGEGTVDLRLTIDEGQQFRIGRIEFVGTERTNDAHLRQTLLIHEDEIYNQELMEESIKRLNGTGWFENISESDVEIKSGDEKGALNVLIHLKEK